MFKLQINMYVFFFHHFPNTFNVSPNQDSFKLDSKNILAYNANNIHLQSRSRSCVVQVPQFLLIRFKITEHLQNSAIQFSHSCRVNKAPAI